MYDTDRQLNFAILRLVRNLIGSATYSPPSYWDGNNSQRITKAVRQPASVEATANISQTSAKESASLIKPAQVVRSASSIPDFPVIYRTEFDRNIKKSSSASSEDNQSDIKAMNTSKSYVPAGSAVCQTCSERKYQDGSDDPGVSFKTPAHIAPGNSAAAVSAHEQEHVGHEQAKAQQEDRKIIAQSVQLYTAICPECGRTYVAGGKTTTTSRSNAVRAQEPDIGQNLDTYA